MMTRTCSECGGKMVKSHKQIGLWIEFGAWAVALVLLTLARMSLVPDHAILWGVIPAIVLISFFHIQKKHWKCTDCGRTIKRHR